MPEIFAGSEAYERFMGRWSRQLAPLVVRFAAVSAGQRVLDCGSGTGALASAVVTGVADVDVIGVDPSSAYVSAAQARTRGARFLVGNAMALPLADARFDVVLSMLVINFIPDAPRALREMTRVTRPGGTVAAAVWDYAEGMEMLRAFWDEAVALDPAIAPRAERTMQLCQQGELAALWRACGLEAVEEAPLTIDLHFTSFDDYWSPFLGGQGPAGAYTVSLSEAQRRALEAQLRRRLLGDRPDGPFTLQGRAWAVRGVVPGDLRRSRRRINHEVTKKSKNTTRQILRTRATTMVAVPACFLDSRPIFVQLPRRHGRRISTMLRCAEWRL